MAFLKCGHILFIQRQLLYKSLLEKRLKVQPTGKLLNLRFSNQAQCETQATAKAVGTYELWFSKRTLFAQCCHSNWILQWVSHFLWIVLCKAQVCIGHEGAVLGCSKGEKQRLSQCSMGVTQFFLQTKTIFIRNTCGRPSPKSMPLFFHKKHTRRAYTDLRQPC